MNSLALCHVDPLSVSGLYDAWREKNKGLTGVLPLNRFLVGAFNPSEKYARQIELFPHGRDEHKKHLKPLYELKSTPSTSVHSLILGSLRK